MHPLTASVASVFVSQHIVMIVLVSLAVLFEAILNTYQQQMKSLFKKKLLSVHDETEIENISIEYYSKKQRLSPIHAGVVALVVLAGLLIYDIRAFSFAILTLAAGILVFKEVINSMISYFFILSNFNVGDDVSVLGIRGEVLRIRPLVTTILGKGEDGEYNGRVTSVPNYQFTWTPVERKEMKRRSYLLGELEVVFVSKDHEMSFEAFMRQLHDFLDHALPLRSIKNVGYYRSYAGARYKLDFSFNGDGHVVVKVTFVSKPRALFDRKEKIATFVESLRKTRA